MNQTRLLCISLIVGGALAFAGCSEGSANGNNLGVKVEVERLKLAEGNEQFAYSGTIEESETIPLSFPSIGTVARVYVSEGATVKKGQLLASLDDRTYQNAFAMANAAELQAEDAMNRLTPMHNNGDLPDVKYVEVQTALQQAKAAAAIARKNLDDCRLYATTDGFVGKRSVDPGMTALPNLASITIVKISKVFARVSVAENEISRMRQGQKARVSVGALGDTSFDGTVEEIGVVADPIAHSYKVKIAVDNLKHEIRPGMICNVTIESRSDAHGVVVPSRAVLIDEKGETYVYVVTPQNIAERKNVVAGELLNDGIEVRNGLQPGDAVVVSGQHKLVDQSTVQVVN